VQEQDRRSRANVDDGERQSVSSDSFRNGRKIHGRLLHRPGSHANRDGDTNQRDAGTYQSENPWNLWNRGTENLRN